MSTFTEIIFKESRCKLVQGINGGAITSILVPGDKLDYFVLVEKCLLKAKTVQVFFIRGQFCHLGLMAHH